MTGRCRIKNSICKRIHEHMKIDKEEYSEVTIFLIINEKAMLLGK